MKYLLKTTLFLSLLSIKICIAEPVSIDGFYQIPLKTGMYAPPDKIEECPPPYRMDEIHEACIEDMDMVNRLAVRKTPDGNLDFATSIWFFNFHNCTAIGTAKASGDGWRYETAEGDCVLDIFVEKDEIVFKTDEKRSCGRYCGAAGSLDDMRFPLSSRTGPPPDDLDCVGYHEKSMCGMPVDFTDKKNEASQ